MRLPAQMDGDLADTLEERVKMREERAEALRNLAQEILTKGDSVAGYFDKETSDPKEVAQWLYRSASNLSTEVAERVTNPRTAAMLRRYLEDFMDKVQGAHDRGELLKREGGAA